MAKEPSGTPSPTPSGTPAGRSQAPSDQEELRDAVALVRVVLDDAVNGQEPLVSPGLRSQYTEAWPEARAAFLELERSVINSELTERLDGAGLSGSSLRLKIAGLRNAFSRMLRGGAGLLRRNTRYFLSWANTILGSLVTVIPVAELAKEYKECIENDLAEQAPEPEAKPAP